MIFRTFSALFLMASLGLGWSVEQDTAWMNKEGCSRYSSRQVREFLKEEVFPRLPFPAEELPKSCQLNPLHDMFLDQEMNKTVRSRGDFQCNLCGKHFRSEFYLDKHLHNFHEDHLRGDNQRVCLADLCPIFGCESSPTSKSHIHYKAGRSSNVPKSRELQNSFGSVDEGCTSASLERQEFKCEAMIRKCFYTVPDLLQKQIHRNVCGALKCEGGILKGSITQRGLSAEYLQGNSADSNWVTNDEDEVDMRKNKGSDDLSDLLYVLRIISIIAIVVFVIGYVLYTGMSIPYVWEVRRTHDRLWRKRDKGGITEKVANLFSKKDHAS